MVVLDWGLVVLDAAMVAFAIRVGGCPTYTSGGCRAQAEQETGAAELDDQNPVASGPDLILAQTNPALLALLDAAPSQPIIFLQVSDPVGGGFVKSLSHPGANITGFTNFEAEIGGKWLQNPQGNCTGRGARSSGSAPGDIRSC